MKYLTSFLLVAFIWTTVTSSKISSLKSVQNALTKEARNRTADRFWSSIVESEVNYRLPNYLVPSHYSLYIKPDIESGRFTGHEEIDVKVVTATNQIILHAYLVIVSNVEVTNANGVEVEVIDFQTESLREFLIINLATNLEEDTNIKLSIQFGGEMNGKIVGLYSSSYLHANGETRTITTSKFEPTYARQAFPCFDEPAMKATFEITLVHPTNGGYHALSNMNQASSTSTTDGFTEVVFAKSVPMSTYLACFIVSDFGHVTEQIEANGIGSNFELRLFATTHQIHKVDFARSTAKSVTEFYISYFQVEYPLPKLDMAAIPDFVSNAVEHWGLVTYRETALLYDENSSTWNKQRVAAVVAHELAHMWFGNLVTMMWWNDLWLNEGFARYMEYKGVNQVYGEWGMLDQFLIHALHSVLIFDSSPASHPIVQTVKSPDEITEIFDTISYEKGASIIRMLEDVITEAKFSQAVTNYLTKFQFSNAVTDDFITEVANVVTDADIKLFMRTWTEQMGFPIVEVKRSTTTSFTLTQKRFFSNIENYENSYDDSPFNYKWTIPLTYYTDASKDVQRLWFDYNEDELTITVDSTVKWLKLNVHQVGYYRVNYEESIWKDIIANLVEAPENFDISDRSHIFNDVFALADASQLSYEIAFDLTKYLEKETEFVPWYVAASKLQSLQTTLRYRESYQNYLQYARNLLENAYSKVTWTIGENNHLENRLRVSILTAACSVGLSDCLTEASTRFSAWLENSEYTIHPDLREIVYYYGMQEVNTQEAWEQLWSRFVAEQTAAEKLKLMYGLAGVRAPWLLYRFIDLAKDETYVRRQDYFTCMQNIAANPVGEPIVWEYVRDNWTALVERFTLNERYLGRMIPTITAGFMTQIKLEEIQVFFAKYPEAGAGATSREQALETVKYNIKWLEENESEVTTWLANNSS